MRICLFAPGDSGGMAQLMASAPLRSDGAGLLVPMVKPFWKRTSTVDREPSTSLLFVTVRSSSAVSLAATDFGPVNSMFRPGAIHSMVLTDLLTDTSSPLVDSLSTSTPTLVRPTRGLICLTRTGALPSASAGTSRKSNPLRVPLTLGGATKSAGSPSMTL